MCRPHSEMSTVFVTIRYYDAVIKTRVLGTSPEDFLYPRLRSNSGRHGLFFLLHLLPTPFVVSRFCWIFFYPCYFAFVVRSISSWFRWRIASFIGELVFFFCSDDCNNIYGIKWQECWCFGGVIRFLFVVFFSNSVYFFYTDAMWNLIEFSCN